MIINTTNIKVTDEGTTKISDKIVNRIAGINTKCRYFLI